MCEKNLVKAGLQGCGLFVRERLDGIGRGGAYRIMVSIVLFALVVIRLVPSDDLT